MTLQQEFLTSGQKQLAVQDRIDMLRAIRTDLGQSRDAATRWEQSAVVGNAVLVPLNVTATAQLKKKGLAEFIPGVNILVGLAEDSVAMFQVANKEWRAKPRCTGWWV